MKNFFGFDPSNHHITSKRVAHAIAANAILVLWAVVVSYLMGKYS
jgi:hypothetical protein